MPNHGGVGQHRHDPAHAPPLGTRMNALWKHPLSVVSYRVLAILGVLSSCHFAHSIRFGSPNTFGSGTSLDKRSLPFIPCAVWMVLIAYLLPVRASCIQSGSHGHLRLHTFARRHEQMAGLLPNFPSPTIDYRKLWALVPRLAVALRYFTYK